MWRQNHQRSLQFWLAHNPSNIMDMSTVESFWTWLIWQIKLPSILVSKEIPIHTENGYLFDTSESLSFLVIVRSALSPCWGLGIFLRDSFSRQFLLKHCNLSSLFGSVPEEVFSITYLISQPQTPKFFLMSIHWFIQFLSGIFKPHFNTLVFSSHSSLPADLHKVIWEDSAILGSPHLYYFSSHFLVLCNGVQIVANFLRTSIFIYLSVLFEEDLEIS